MRSELLGVLLLAIVVMAGCTGPAIPNVAGTSGTSSDTGSGTMPPGTSVNCLPNSGISKSEFPPSSSLDVSVYDSHAKFLENTSFTLRIEKQEKRTHPQPPPNFIYFNSSERILAEPGASQYLSQLNGTSDFLGTQGLHSTYANDSGVYALLREDGEWTVEEDSVNGSIFDPSSEHYLWGQWKADYWVLEYNVTFDRTCLTTFEGVSVMRYDASGAEALPSHYNKSAVNAFSSTLLLDKDGVIRYFRYDFNRTLGDELRAEAWTYTVRNVGDTDVDKPDWVANATAGS